jgi:hypothetical protein
MSILTEVATVCVSCGVAVTGDRPPHSWSLALIDGHKIWTCDSCIRSELFMIEARLDG